MVGKGGKVYILIFFAYIPTVSTSVSVIDSSYGKLKEDVQQKGRLYF